MNEQFLSFNEKVGFALRSLYASRGYAQYKMSKFEEYDLYAQNKDFLISDSVITFTDTNGKLMALKPDVTLSIIKNSKDEPSALNKVFYNENVYRISGGSHSYKEIMQAGLECFGDVDAFSICEVLSLAAKSLMLISENCVLDISHLGLIENLFESFAVPSFARGQILKFIGEKNLHELDAFCKKLGMPQENVDAIKLIVSTSGAPVGVLSTLTEALKGKTDITPLIELGEMLSAAPELKEILRIDFSVVGDMKYYNGIVFKGFIEGIPASVLSGGQYDKLMQKMHRRSRAIGFAVYLDMLERMEPQTASFDADTVVLYSAQSDLVALSRYADALRAKGQRVLVVKNEPSIQYRNLIRFDSEVTNNENNA